MRISFPSISSEVAVQDAIDIVVESSDEAVEISERNKQHERCEKKVFDDEFFSESHVVYRANANFSDERLLSKELRHKKVKLNQLRLVCKTLNLSQQVYVLIFIKKIEQRFITRKE